MNKIVGGIVALVIVGGGAFYGGMQYAKAQGPSRGNFGQFAGAAGARTFSRGGAAAGQIISVTQTGITLKTQTGSSLNIFLGTSTQILKTATGSLSDLSTGANVVVAGTSNSDDSITAQSIQIRPAGMQGFGGRPTGSQ
jgi:hypothetical protein